MARCLYLLVVFAGLAAWAGAQNPAPPLSPEDKLRLLRSNGTLLENLVRDGVAISAADTPEKRAEECRNAALALANEIQKAAADDDAERVAELAALFRDLVRDGLAPTISDGLRSVNPKSPAAAKLREVREWADRDMTAVRAAAAKLADHPRVKDALKQLDELADVPK